MIPEEVAQPPLYLLIVDDDEVSLEVLTMLAEAEGYRVEATDSGAEAVVWLGERHDDYPDAILTDLQMPGMSGDELAAALRSVCGERTVLLAMSGSEPKKPLKHFDGFLLKPFTIQQVAAIVSCRRVETLAEPAELPVLDEPTYAKLRQSMGDEKLAALFNMFLADVDKRLMTMRNAVHESDDATYRSAAHAIKGGCGMVGAKEMHRLAKAMEDSGIDDGSLDSLAAFVLAAARLRGILVAQATQ